MESRVQKVKEANLELLRCIAMMMVIVLHYLGKGGILGNVAEPAMSATGTVAWLLEAFCIVAVNVYMLISGYFLSTSSFKLSRLLQLWLQLWFYSVGVGVLAAALGLVPGEMLNTNYLLKLLFPVSMGHYWFLTAYIFLYLLLPMVTVALKRMNQCQMRVTMVSLLVVFSLAKSVFPVRLEMDGKGYDCLWYLCVFVFAAYIRRFGGDFFDSKRKGLALYVMGSIAVFVEIMGLHMLYVRTGSLGLLLTVSTEYNHIFPLLAAVGLFVVFKNVKISGGFARAICKIAPYTLGVYLLHENIGVRNIWQNWLGADRIGSVAALLGWTCVAVVIVFAVGIVVDFLRELLMKGIHRVLLYIKPYRKTVDKILRIDASFQDGVNSER